jgi:hypothetical protein
MLPTKFRFIWPSGFRGEDLKMSANQKQELPMVAMFVNVVCLFSGENESLCSMLMSWYMSGYHTGFYQVYILAHLAKGNVSFCHHLSSVIR